MGGGAAGVEGEDRKFPCERRGRILRFETQICRFVVAENNIREAASCLRGATFSDGPASASVSLCLILYLFHC